MSWTTEGARARVVTSSLKCNSSKGAQPYAEGAEKYHALDVQGRTREPLYMFLYMFAFANPA
jgi:hypothetical protein